MQPPAPAGSIEAVARAKVEQSLHQPQMQFSQTVHLTSPGSTLSIRRHGFGDPSSFHSRSRSFESGTRDARDAFMNAPAGAGSRQRVVLFGAHPHSLINFRGPLIRAMIERGHEVIAIAGDIDSETAAKVQALGARPISVALSRASLNPLEALRSGRQLRRLFASLRADVVIAYTIKPIVLGAPAVRAAGIPRFVPLVTGLGYAFTGGLEPKRLLSRAAASIMYRRAFKRSNIAVFQNPDDLADFRRLHLLPRKLPTALIHGSGIDLSHYREAPLPPGPSFLMIARLLGDKGVREFGNASRRLKQEFPELKISLVGPLDPSPDSISQAELEGIIAGGIDYRGGLADVRPAIAEHSVYVLPSYREGTPRSVLEAMAMGRAVITTDAPGCRQTVVNGEGGILVPPRDPDALYRAMKQLVMEPERIIPMAKASRKMAMDKFDVIKVSEELLRHAGL